MHAQHAVDLIVGRAGSLVQQILGADNDAGSAESALQATGSHEAIGKGVTFAFAEAFKGQDALAVGGSRGNGAGGQCSTLYQDRTATALALRAAAVLGRD